MYQKIKLKFNWFPGFSLLSCLHVKELDGCHERPWIQVPLQLTTHLLQKAKMGNVNSGFTWTGVDGCERNRDRAHYAKAEFKWRILFQLDTINAN